MAWMAETFARRADPQVLWPEARSVVMLALNYGPAVDPLAALERRDRGAISVYARNRDYHEVVKGKLKTLAAWLVAAARPQAAEVKVFVDTAPVMEKPLAAAAGLGWQGKHTNLVSREFGSWLFLGAIFTDLELPPDEAERDHCGSCRACLDACPTAAFPAPYKLDARRCISYLTIEHKGTIAPRAAAADRQSHLRLRRLPRGLSVEQVRPRRRRSEACRRATTSRRRRSPNSPRSTTPAFRARFAGGPIKRIGHARFLRNVMIAIGNSGDRSLIAAARKGIEAEFAAGQGDGGVGVRPTRRCADVKAAALRFAPEERDAAVLEEWKITLTVPAER